MTELLIRYTHFVGIIVLASMLITQNILLQANMDNKLFKKLIWIDGLLGLGALMTLVAGLLLWFSVGKPAAFYSTNILFQLKLGIFIFLAILSVFPTIFLIGKRNTEEQVVTVPGRIIKTKRVELIMLFTLPLLAVMMARGVGH